MAVLISAADGNLTAAATVWDIVSTGTGAIQATKTTFTFTTTSYVYSSAFTGTNLDIVDGLLLFCRRLNTTGTVTIALSEDNGTTDTRNLTVNASDLPAEYSWVFFKFGSSLTLDGGTDYKVGVKGSSASNASFYRDGTAGNWVRYLRKVSLATAGAGDVMYIAGEITAAGATTTRTITMDSTATTDYGTGTDGAVDNGIEIGNAGVLTYGTTAATNYYLKLSGSLNVWGSGTLNIGTTGTPMPRDSTAVLEIDPVADGGMGLIVQDGGTANIQGQSRTSGKNIIACKLNTDEAANSTSLGVDTDTGWLDNDEIVVASTTRTATQTEKGTLNGAAGASSLTVDGFAGAGGGVLNAHSGTSPTQAEVVLLTRNVKVRSATSTIMIYVQATAVSTIDIDWAEFVYMGESASSVKQGFGVSTTTGSFNIQYSSLHDFEDYGMTISSTSGSNIVFSNNICYNLNTAAVASSRTIDISATSGVHTISGNYFLACSCASNGNVILLSDVGLTFTNNVIAGSGNGSTSNAISLNEGAQLGTFSGNTIHSMAGNGLSNQSGAVYGTFGSLTNWFNTGSGNNISGSYGLIFDTHTYFGNGNHNISMTGGGIYNHYKSCTFNGHATFTTGNGIFTGGNGVMKLTDCSFGATTTHTTADISIQNNGMMRTIAFNTTFATSSEYAIQTGGNNVQTSLQSQKHDASSTTFKTIHSWGVILNDTTTRHTASGYSWKMTPNNASQKLILPGPTTFDTFKAAVNASALVTIKVWCQKDGSYNGTAPRLVLVGGIIGGIASDVTASLTVGASTWEELTVTGTPNEAGTVEFYCDVDGTAGSVYWDDFTISQA